ncbi:hypothetical protein HII31_02483 [Pseudocercospora fuligena]|uniref:Uncharacterized protein n=1 Tax=Pseudocercospora fuligena TaxID=685502 RepID=A0A8H6RRR3_9PEZI|nr:hypothetical protein HII31_02483 [Pseudocercospora fuligena]
MAYAVVLPVEGAASWLVPCASVCQTLVGHEFSRPASDCPLPAARVTHEERERTQETQAGNKKLIQMPSFRRHCIHRSVTSSAKGMELPNPRLLECERGGLGTICAHALSSEHKNLKQSCLVTLKLLDPLRILRRSSSTRNTVKTSFRIRTLLPMSQADRMSSSDSDVSIFLALAPAYSEMLEDKDPARRGNGT